MKNIFLLLVSFLANQVCATTLTCTNTQSSPATQWTASSDGEVGFGSIAVSQPLTKIWTTLITGESQQLEFTRFEGLKFHGGCHIDFENVVARKTENIFDCGLHGYGRSFFGPLGLSCNNRDESQVLITYDQRTEKVSWHVRYSFGSCYIHKQKLEFDIFSEPATFGAVFDRQDCHLVD